MSKALWNQIMHKTHNNALGNDFFFAPLLLSLWEKYKLLSRIIEKAGRGKVILSRKYYEHTGRKGEYTRRRGLDKGTNKQLLIKHLEHHRKGYIEDFVEALKDVPKYTVNRYLKELKDEETIELIGNPKITKGDKKAFWRLKQ